MLLPKNRPPTTPGQMLLEEFLRPRGLTQVELARRMDVPIQRVNTIVNGKRGITAETAILLAETLGTTPDFWMNVQVAHDLWLALRRRAAGREGRLAPARRLSRPRGARPPARTQR